MAIYDLILEYGVHANAEIKGKVFEEAHKTKYTMHPGSTEMYQNIKRNFWWLRMKREVTKYVVQCLICPQI